MTRADGRELHEMRAVKIQRSHTMHAEGSVLISFGNTKVLCNASFTPGVPRFKKDSGEGWVTAEYGVAHTVLSPESLPSNTRKSVRLVCF